MFLRILFIAILKSPLLFEIKVALRERYVAILNDAMRFEIKTCAEVSAIVLSKCSHRPSLSLSLILFLFCVLQFMRSSGKPAPAIIRYASPGTIRSHGLSCTLGTTRVIQSPGSGSFELIMGNIYRGRISGMRRIERDDKYFVRRRLEHAASQIGRRGRSRLDEPHDISRSAERSIST